ASAAPVRLDPSNRARRAGRSPALRVESTGRTGRSERTSRGRGVALLLRITGRSQPPACAVEQWSCEDCASRRSRSSAADQLLMEGVSMRHITAFAVLSFSFSFTAAAQSVTIVPKVTRAQEAMKNLQPDQRKQMEAAMGSMFTFDVQKLGNSRKIAGYNCDEWSVTMGQMSKTVECVSTEVKFPPLAWNMYKSFTDSMKSLTTAMGPMAANTEKLQGPLQKTKGFPL